MNVLEFYGDDNDDINNLNYNFILSYSISKYVK